MRSLAQPHRGDVLAPCAYRQARVEAHRVAPSHAFTQQVAAGCTRLQQIVEDEEPACAGSVFCGAGVRPEVVCITEEGS